MGVGRGVERFILLEDGRKTEKVIGLVVRVSSPDPGSVFCDVLTQAGDLHHTSVGNLEDGNSVRNGAEPEERKRQT